MGLGHVVAELLILSQAVVGEVAELVDQGLYVQIAALGGTENIGRAIGGQADSDAQRAGAGQYVQIVETVVPHIAVQFPVFAGDCIHIGLHSVQHLLLGHVLQGGEPDGGQGAEAGLGDQQFGLQTGQKGLDRAMEEGGLLRRIVPAVDSLIGVLDIVIIALGGGVLIAHLYQLQVDRGEDPIADGGQLPHQGQIGILLQ